MSIELVPNKFVAKTKIGTFDIKITNREYITIGTKTGCVQIGYNNRSNTASLDWLGTEKGGCEALGKDIRGQKTIIMVDLGFTILRQLYPDVNPEVSLCDSSTFKCILPNNTPVHISNMIYNLLLSGKTYYQNKFNAKLKYKASEPAYNHFIRTREDPSIFDKSYNFNNDDLNTLLQPVLQESTNWGDFFNKLHTKFGRQTCVVIYSWYQSVYGYLAQEAIHSEWLIDISNRNKIDYDIISKNNSKNYTRKNFIYNPYEFSGGYFPSLMKYDNFLHL